MKKSTVRRAIKEVIEELSTSAGAGGYLTPFAFSKNKKKNNATKQSEKLGYRVVKTKKRPAPRQSTLRPWFSEARTTKVACLELIESCVGI